MEGVQYTFTRSFNELNKDDVGLAGGKGASLGEMTHAGFSVPPGYVVLTNAFDCFLDEMHLLQSIQLELGRVEYDTFRTLEHASEQIQTLIRKASVPEDIRRAIFNAYVELGAKRVAVRSSATSEDGAKNTWAGQLDSFLDVTEKDLMESVVRCWASLYSPRAIRYRLERSIAKQNISVAVIVQKMLKSETSGVAFSVHPVTEDPSKIVIEACAGLGTSIVSGTITPDRYIVDRNTDLFGENPFTTNSNNMFDTQHNLDTQNKNLQHQQNTQACISTETLYDIVQLVFKLEKYWGVPVDIEWATQNATLFVLQCRPISTLGTKVIYDRSNIAESYAGVVTPLTYSFVRYVYQEVYQHFCGAMGVREQVIRAHHDMFRHMVTSIRHTMYYNLLNWYRMVQLFPYYQYSSEFMEQMMGVEKQYRGYWKQDKSGSVRMRVVTLSSTFAHMLVIVWSFMLLPVRMRHFNRTFDTYERSMRKKIAKTDMNATELHELYVQLDRDLIKKWRTPIINDFAVMVSSGMLNKLTRCWMHTDTDALLLTHHRTRDCISTKPGYLLQRILVALHSDSEIATIFKSAKSNHDIWNILQCSYSGTEVVQLIETYIHEFGNRVSNELKLESITLDDDPTLLIALLRHNFQQPYVQQPSWKSDADANSLSNIAVHRRVIIACLMVLARTAIRYREESRFRRGRAFDIVRKVFQKIGEQFAREGILEHSRDIFFLTTDEIFAYILKDVDFIDKKMIEERKIRYECDAQQHMPRRIETVVSIEHIEELFDVRPEEQGAHEVLCVGEVTSARGTGIHKGTVLVLPSFDSSADFNGKVLVTRHTDPGWTPVFPLLRAIIIEHGGMLSHASIVARELGIPCIVGVTNATQILKNGQTITLDTMNGVIATL